MYVYVYVPELLRKSSAESLGKETSYLTGGIILFVIELGHCIHKALH